MTGFIYPTLLNVENPPKDSRWVLLIDGGVQSRQCFSTWTCRGLCVAYSTLSWGILTLVLGVTHTLLMRQLGQFQVILRPMAPPASPVNPEALKLQFQKHTPETQLLIQQITCP